MSIQHKPSEWLIDEVRDDEDKVFLSRDGEVTIVFTNSQFVEFLKELNLLVKSDAPFERDPTNFWRFQTYTSKVEIEFGNDTVFVRVLMTVKEIEEWHILLSSQYREAKADQ